jgi:membrane-associated phospholipid phosphatase
MAIQQLIRLRRTRAIAAAGMMLIAVAPVWAQTPAPDDGAARSFLIDVAHDYRNMVSWETAQWLAIGGVVSLVVAEADEALREATQDPEAPVTLAREPGATYGNTTIQLPLAIGWWAVAHAAGSERGAAAGRDLLRAQISAFSWTYAIKYAVDRQRPNGDPRSFPSGHSSATFAAAMVFQEHYGWKVGVPLFAAAAYTAASRITVNKHWASDVAFGAFVGMASGRTVTLQLRRARFTVAPVRTAGGAAIMFTKS